MSQPWHAAFRSTVEQITVVIGASSEGREQDQRGNRWSRAREIGGLVWFRDLALTLRGLTTSRTLKTSTRGVLALKASST
jgi:hypothetical protein